MSHMSQLSASSTSEEAAVHQEGSGGAIELALTPPPLPTSRPPLVAYRLNSTRATYGELLRDIGPVGFVLLGAPSKLLRIPLPGSVNDANVQTLESIEVRREDVPAEVEKNLARGEADIAALGFPATPRLCHVLADINPQSRVATSSFVSSDGRTIARVTSRAFGMRYGSKRWFVEFFSRRTDGTWLWTTSARATLNTPATQVQVRVAGAQVAKLWEMHRARLDKENLPLQTFGGDSGLPLALEAQHAELREYHLQRGLFAPMPADQQAILATIQSGDPDAAVLAEVERLQDKETTSRGKFVFILVLSLVAFLVFAKFGSGHVGGGEGGGGGGTDAGAGLRSGFWSWQSLAVLVPVLLFHELGHFVAMKLLGYRNLKMFFIPMFGAAVMGTSRGAPGWKKAMVSLAGPVPGLAVGVVLATVLVFRSLAGQVPVDTSTWMFRATVMLLALNAFNLLPILPLDGGHVVRTLLFARHWVLDLIFRIVAIAGLLGVTVLTGGKALMYLGIAMAVGIPMAIVSGRVAQRLKNEGLSTAVDERGRIPRATSARIVAALREKASTKGKPSRLTVQNRAQQSIQIFESLAERSPNWIATILFLVTYLGSIAAALVVGSALVVVVRPGGLASLAMNKPAAHSISYSDVEVVKQFPRDATRPGSSAQLPGGSTSAAYGATKAPDRGPERACIGLELSSKREAREAVNEWKPLLQDDEGMLRVGQTVFISMRQQPSRVSKSARPSRESQEPEVPRRAFWIDEVEKRTQTYAFAYAGGSPDIHLTVTMPSKKATDELNETLSTGNFLFNRRTHVIPEWSPMWTNALPEQVTRWQTARHTATQWTKARDEASKETAAAMDVSGKLKNSLKRGEHVDFTQLSKQMDEACNRLRATKVEALRARTDIAIDEEMIRLLELRAQELAKQAKEAEAAVSRPTSRSTTSPVSSAAAIEDDEDAPTTASPEVGATEIQIAQRLGCIDYLPPSERIWGYELGVYTQPGLLQSLEIHIFHLDEPTVTLPAFFDYLKAHGAYLRFEVAPADAN
jgi:Zn-dependent protease